MSQLTKRTLILSKIESTYGTDPSPVPASDAIEVLADPTFTPNVTLIERNNIRESLSPSAPRVGKKLWDISFQVEMKSSGTSDAGGASDAPQLDSLLRACAMARTLNAESSMGAGDGDITYAPISTAFESITIYAYLDGILHNFNGCYGSWSLDMNAGEVGVFTFNFTGLYAEPTDVAFPAGAVFEATIPPYGQSMSWNFGAFTTPVIPQVTIDYGLTIAERLDLNSAEGLKGLLITQRQPSGNFIFESELMATKNIWSELTAGTTQAVTGQMGATGGEIVEVSLPNMQWTQPNYEDREGIRMWNMGFIPSGDDSEISLIFK